MGFNAEALRVIHGQPLPRAGLSTWYFFGAEAKAACEHFYSSVERMVSRPASTPADPPRPNYRATPEGEYIDGVLYPWPK